MFAAWEPRLVHTIQHSGNPNSHITLQSLSWGGRRNCISEMILIPAEIVASLRRNARQLAVADEIAMLSVLGVALAWLDTKHTLRVGMVAPQRDGPSETEMVGLFADFRLLNICTEGLNLLGVLLRLHHCVKERIWMPPGLVTQEFGPFINFEWTDFESRHGFSQTTEIRKTHERTQGPIKLAIDQPDRTSWRIRATFDDNVYPLARREAFFEYLKQSFLRLLEEPLKPVWPAP
eukprot:gnl/MRDRNA2_/MRDRNA2_273475_c0_seq1.p1 gnl/MRDRNA2_/MRDRNA2_273475_c0~~gnl/MRDRNA2_/MRDRNA2_273475_c0_seq1.p1  ORF type:complete len:252 (+),score=33.79 gnl/MRDRNA2_/MRDRNA2_273475_c0_seq1:57-758(+)